MTPKEKAIDMVDMFHFNEKEYDVGIEMCKISAIKTIDFYITQHKKWSENNCCAEDFDYNYWLIVKHEIGEL